VDVRKRIAYKEAFISIIGNFFITLFKGYLGILFNAVSLLTDAVHSLGDILTSFLVFIGFRAASKPPDKEHPYGHGRAEEIATLTIAFLLLVAGIEMGHRSFDRIFNPKILPIPSVLIYAILLTALMKEWMARFSKRLGNRINSRALIVDAWHHRSDALATLLVSIGLFAVQKGYLFIDGVFGLIVSGIIIYTAVRFLRESTSALIGEAPSEELLERIRRAAKIEGVRSIHNIRVHHYGNYKEITLHIEVQSDITIEKAHELATLVEKRVEEEVGGTVIAHAEPEQTDGK
jgi:cation diffusion facilitator family transporter